MVGQVEAEVVNRGVDMDLCLYLWWDLDKIMRLKYLFWFWFKKTAFRRKKFSPAQLHQAGPVLFLDYGIPKVARRIAGLGFDATTFDPEDGLHQAALQYALNAGIHPGAGDVCATWQRILSMQHGCRISQLFGIFHNSSEIKAKQVIQNGYCKH